MADSLTAPALGWDHVSPGWPHYREACRRWEAGDDRGAALLARLALEVHLRQATAIHAPGPWRDLHEAGGRLRRAGMIGNRTRKELRRLVRPANAAIHGGSLEVGAIRAMLAAIPVVLRCWL